MEPVTSPPKFTPSARKGCLALCVAGFGLFCVACYGLLSMEPDSTDPLKVERPSACTKERAAQRFCVGDTVVDMCFSKHVVAHITVPGDSSYGGQVETVNANRYVSCGALGKRVRQYGAFRVGQYVIWARNGVVPPAAEAKAFPILDLMSRGQALLLIINSDTASHLKLPVPVTDLRPLAH